MKKEKADVGYKDGSLYYNPKDPESINAAIQEAVTLSQAAAFKAGQDEVNYTTGYKKGLGDGIVRGIIITSAIYVITFVVAGIVLKKRGK